MPEIIKGVVFPPRRRYTRWVTEAYQSMQPGDTVTCSCVNEAMAVRNWGRSKPRLWKMRQLKQPNGTYLVGRVE